MSAVEYGQSVAHIVGMSESGHRSCKCGAVYDRSEHIAEVARKISSFECAVCAPPTQCASGPTHSRSSSPVHRQGGRRRGSERPHSCTVLISDTVEQELGHPKTHNAAKPNDAWWRCVRSGQCNPPVTTVSTMRASHRARFGHRRATARLWSVPLFPLVTAMDAVQHRLQIQVERPCTLGRLRIKFGGNCVGPH